MIGRTVCNFLTQRMNTSQIKLKEKDPHRSAVKSSENLMSRQLLTNWRRCTTWKLSSRWYRHYPGITLVFDWRFRGNSWIRRCRVAAREFPTTNTDENIFSPTSAFSAVRMLLTFAVMYGLAVTSLDIKDAFLMVPQVEVMYVEITQWVCERTGKPETHWLLRRCLPGQRNAALRWHQHFAKIFVKPQGLDLFLVHRQCCDMKNLMRKIYVNVHVDDILVVCKPEEVQWFQDAGGSTLTMKVDGPHLPASGEQLMYLKKRITMREDGILIQSNATYVPKLVAMMKVSGRRKKGLPYHATPETFNAEFVVESEMLDGEQGGLFRSGLGLTLYMAMDRPDIQFVVKVLSSYMSRPSVKAVSALKNLASYLEGTPDDGILLRSTEEGKMVSDFWKEDDFIQDEVTSPDWTADGRFILEAFSDSSWADCKATRRSSSSGLIFLNGSLLTSMCRTQASVALTSCEAELYAANGLMVESLFLYRLCKFLVGDETEGNSDKVQ